MASTSLLFSYTVFLLSLHVSSIGSALHTSISAATDVLSDSGYFSMAITLQITSAAMNLSDLPSFTIFAPLDNAFVQSGQPSLLDLQYQISPKRLSREILEDLSSGMEIPSLRSDAPFLVTGSSDSCGKFSINNVIIQDSAIFDDGYVAVYGTDEFFKPFSQTFPSIVPTPEFSPDFSPNSQIGSQTFPSIIPTPEFSPDSSPNSQIGSSPNSLPDLSPKSSQIPPSTDKAPELSPSLPNDSGSDSPGSEFPAASNTNLPYHYPKFLSHASPTLPDSFSGFDPDINVFEQASNLLMSSGYTIIGTFLDLQLEISANRTRLTIFAPVDEAISESVTNFANYSMIFRGHVVQKLLTWKELREIDEGTILQSAMRGFMMNLSWSGNILLINGVPVVFPDLYVSDWIAIHGINRMIVPQSRQDPMGESFSELDGGGEADDHQDSPDFGDYGGVR